MVRYSAAHRKQRSEIFGRCLPGFDSGVGGSGPLPAWQYSCFHDLVGQVETYMQPRRAVVNDCALVVWSNAVSKNPEQFIIYLRPRGDAVAHQRVEFVTELLPCFGLILDHAAITLENAPNRARRLRKPTRIRAERASE
jgi:hypothetical protein